MKTTLSRARVGFLFFIGVLIFVVAIFLVGEKTQLFSSTFTVRVNFSSAEGVKPGTFVVLSGYTVGSVSEISLSPGADSIRLLLRIDTEVQPFIKSDSKAEIKQEGLVGNKLINLLIGSSDLPPVRDGDFIQGVPPFALTSLADNVTSITDTSKIIAGELKELFGRLNRGEGSLGRLLTDEAVYMNLLRITTLADSGMEIATSQMGRVSEILQRLTVSVDALIRSSDTAVASVAVATGELRQMLRTINSGEGTVGALLTDRGLYDTLVTLLSALNDVAYDAGNASNQLAQSLYAMRKHWLAGRIFGGEGIENETPPAPSYRKLMRELKARAAELDRREKRLREMERQLDSLPAVRRR